MACPYDPRAIPRGLPIGMHHCPICGEMVIAGMEHTPELTEEEEAAMWEDLRRVWAPLPDEEDDEF